MELNILCLVLSFKGVHNHPLMEMLESSPDLVHSRMKRISEVHLNLELYKFTHLIAENELYLEYILRIYYSGGKGLMNRIKTLANYKSLFQFVFLLSGGNVEVTKNMLCKDLSACVLAHCESQLNCRELKRFLSSNFHIFSDLVENFYLLKPFMRKFEHEVMFTFKKYVINYPNQLLDFKSLHKYLFNLIENNDFYYEFENLREPLCLTALKIPESIKIKELITPFDLKKEGEDMANCLGTHGYDHKIKSAQSRVFSIIYKNLRGSLEMITPESGAPYIGELKMKYNEEPDKFLLIIARYIEKELKRIVIL